MATKRGKKVDQKHYKKRIPAFRIAHFLKKKKKKERKKKKRSIALSFFSKNLWDKPGFFFVA